MQTKVKCYGDEATDFHAHDIPKASFDYSCLAVINVNSALKKIKMKNKLIARCIFLKNNFFTTLEHNNIFGSVGLFFKLKPIGQMK